jgi:hypothetical protein
VKGPLLGYVPDAPDVRDFHFDDSPLLGAAPIVTADEIDLRKYLDRIQTQTLNDCVGHFIAGAAYCTAAAAGEPIERPSPLYPYTMGRARTQRGKLIDAGVSPRDAMLGIAEYGLVANARWPECEAFANAMPSLDALEEGDCARISAFYRIPEGPGAATAAKLSLRRGRFPGFGLIADEAFENIGTGILSRPGGKVLGGHMLYLIAWSPILNAFRYVNHWGTSYGDEGFGWISADYFESSACFDRWVIDVVPPEVA